MALGNYFRLGAKGEEIPTSKTSGTSLWTFETSGRPTTSYPASWCRPILSSRTALARNAWTRRTTTRREH